ncbi:hypothetical protein N0V94_009114 [Neodidymelliopsis sp. IMI 364377]|nr:hypothetical protein N0V94_009114 [Neodidymelliopsis sp. IMI 364377]
MTFHNNKLREVSIYGNDKDDLPQSAPRDIPGAGAGRQPESNKVKVKTEDHCESKKRKRKDEEALRFQYLHGQCAVDATRAADMDDIHYSEPFAGFNFRSSDAPSYHNTMYQTPSHRTDYYDFENSASSGPVRTWSGDTLVSGSFVPGSYGTAHSLEANQTYFSDIADEGRVNVKHEDAQDGYSVSATPEEESDFAASESEEERPRKMPKINKDGALRKPRQPRPKLLKWNDDDWKNVCLGIVWACGEVGVQIPFDQAAQIVGEKCTAGALQQALLKLRGKQIAEGHQIPMLKMAWTRKNKYVGSAKSKSQEPEANKFRKKPTRMEATQSYLVTLPRAYKNIDRKGMVCPYKWKKPVHKARLGALRSSADTKQAGSSASSSAMFDDNQQHQSSAGSFMHPQQEMTQIFSSPLLIRQQQTHGPSGALAPNHTSSFHGDTAVYDYVNNDNVHTSYFNSPNDLLSLESPGNDGFSYGPPTPDNSQHAMESFGMHTPMTGLRGNNTGHLQGMTIGQGEYVNLLDFDGLHDLGNGFADATDDVFTN